MPKKETKERIPMITKTRLKSERGWTDKLLKIFLPEPDLKRPNPNYRSAAPMLLFDLDKVKTIEKTEEFQLEQAKATKRKQAAKKATETKKEQLKKWLDTIQVNVPIHNKRELIKDACEHYNNMQIERELEGRSTSGMFATRDSDSGFLERICVNYLRHCLTDYEEYLWMMSGKVGFGDGYHEIRRKIFDKISENYPWLADECERQR